MAPFTPRGERPLWREVYDHAMTLDTNDVIDWQCLKDLIGYDPSLPGSSRTPILTASRRLLREHSRLLVSVRGKGYRIAEAAEQEGYARGDQRSARRKLTNAHAKAVHVNKNDLTETQRASIDALAHVLAAQNAMLKRHDVRLTTVEETAKVQDARLDVLEATLRRHGIDVPDRTPIPGEVVEG